MRKEMITAIEQEGLQTRSVGYIFTVHDDKITDLPGTIKRACIAYVNTASGFQNYQQNCNCFNWGDVDYVPNSFFRQYGIEKDEMLVDEQLTVDYYEQLVSDENLKFLDEKWQTLKQELFVYGAEALEDFIGTELDENLEKDSIEKMLDEIADQMPDEELYEFYSKYCLTEQVAKEQRIQKLVKDMDDALSYISSGDELEMDYFDDIEINGQHKSGWFACRYDGHNSTVLQEFSDQSLIMEDEISKFDIDIRKLFNDHHIAYCG